MMYSNGDNSCHTTLLYRWMNLWLLSENHFFIRPSFILCWMMLQIGLLWFFQTTEKSAQRRRGNKAWIAAAVVVTVIVIILVVIVVVLYMVKRYVEVPEIQTHACWIEQDLRQLFRRLLVIKNNNYYNIPASHVNGVRKSRLPSWRTCYFALFVHNPVPNDSNELCTLSHTDKPPHSDLH